MIWLQQGVDGGGEGGGPAPYLPLLFHLTARRPLGDKLHGGMC